MSGEHEPGEVHSHDGLRLACGAAEPVVFAGRADVTFRSAHGRAELCEQISGVFAELSRLLAEAGCTLVGHIKGSLDGGDGRVLQFSSTTLGGAVSFRGDGLNGADRAVLTLNVIVFGLGEAALADAVRGSLTLWPAAQVRWR